MRILAALLFLARCIVAGILFGFALRWWLEAIFDAGDIDLDDPDDPSEPISPLDPAWDQAAAGALALELPAAQGEPS